MLPKIVEKKEIFLFVTQCRFFFLSLSLYFGVNKNRTKTQSNTHARTIYTIEKETVYKDFNGILWFNRKQN